jgi:hypothetical protein
MLAFCQALTTARRTPNALAEKPVVAGPGKAPHNWGLADRAPEEHRHEHAIR